MSPKEAWTKWLVDLSGTRTQVVVVVFGLWTWAWADLLLRPHTPEHTLELLKASTPTILAGVFAWVAGKAVEGIRGARSRYREVPPQDE